jgi:hypothetical protein
LSDLKTFPEHHGVSVFLLKNNGNDVLIAINAAAATACQWWLQIAYCDLFMEFIIN